MGIYWNSYGWDCSDCSDWYTVSTGPIQTWSAEAQAAAIKAAYDHARNCPALNEVGQQPRDYSNEAIDRLNRAIQEANESDLREYGAYNERVPNTLPPSDDHEWLDQFSGSFPPDNQVSPAPVNTNLRGPDLAPETIMEGITRVLKADLPRAQKQAKVKPHENYRLDPEDRVDGHPTRPR
ncbi:hypothetical protein LCGC14_0657760 [marine sediment metagenome]|uniref:Uncharacterized protein n=1 Tax=marine sediment metagenome TaxID=412755 RepID=A0A0F9REE6_9ZZZZ